jgi:serine/threonine-protein kinase
MVAAAGAVEGMPRKWALACLALAVGFLLAQLPIRQQRTALFRAALDRPPDVLAHLSRTAAESLGYTRKPADSVIWLEHRTDLIRHLQNLPEPRHWDEWYAAEAPVISIYRESPQPLEARPFGSVTTLNPPPLTTGMATVILDGNGRLRDFAAVPYPEGSAPVPPETVFRAAGLEMTGFTETTPQKLPGHPFDQWRAWKGPHPKIPNTEVLVEIASWKGQTTKVTVSLRRPAGATAASGAGDLGHLQDLAGWTLFGLGGFFVVLLAHRNWKLQRTDIQGAWRVAGACFLLAGGAWAGMVHPVPSQAFLENAVAGAGDWLLSAAILFLVYLALEPAVRARWPHSIVTWNRVLAGRWRDAQVASDILIGAAVGTGMFTLFKLFSILLPHQVSPLNTDVSLNFAMGFRQWAGGHAHNVFGGLRFGLFIFLTIFGLRRLLRSDVLAALAAALLFTLMQGELSYSQERLVIMALYIVVYGALTFVLLRSGLVATISTLFFANSGNTVMLGTDWNTWYAPYGIASLALLTGIAVWAFWRSLGGRELLQGEDPAG